MLNYFDFGNIRSTDFKTYISGSGVYNAPARSYNTVSVPGRNGDLIISADKYENITVKYPAFISTDFKQNLADLRSALLSMSGYQELVDSYHPDEFRLAYFAGGISVKARTQNDGGEFDLAFDCKPQRFLIAGKFTHSLADGDAIQNPTPFNAKPLIKVTGYGNLTINNEVITIANAYASVMIDSDIMDCYSGTANANGAVTFASGDFPELYPGSNGIEYDNTITAVEITPRWWIL